MRGKTMHPSDKVYALAVAVKLAEDHGQPSNVVSDLKQLHADAIRELRGE